MRSPPANARMSCSGSETVKTNAFKLGGHTLARALVLIFSSLSLKAPSLKALFAWKVAVATHKLLS